MCMSCPLHGWDEQDEVAFIGIPMSIFISKMTKFISILIKLCVSDKDFNKFSRYRNVLTLGSSTFASVEDKAWPQWL